MKILSLCIKSLGKAREAVWIANCAAGSAFPFGSQWNMIESSSHFICFGLWEKKNTPTKTNEAHSSGMMRRNE